MRFSRAFYVVLFTLIAAMMLCIGFTFPFEVAFYLAFGWIRYLYRVLPQVTWDWPTLLGAVALLAVFTCGMHWLLSCLGRHRSSVAATDLAPHSFAPPRWRWSWTAAIVLLIFLTFIAGISMVGIAHQASWLATSSEPITVHPFREIAQRSQSATCLRQSAGTMQQAGVLPPGATEGPHGRLLHGWQTMLLPYIEQEEFFARIRLDRAWHEPVNREPLATPVKLYGYQPALFGQSPANGLAPSVYAGNSHLLGGTRVWRLDEVTDGHHQTILAGEVVGNLPAWGQPSNCRNPAEGLLDTDTTFGSPWKRGVNFSFLDGSVQSLSREIDPEVLRALATPTGGDSIHRP